MKDPALTPFEREVFASTFGARYALNPMELRRDEELRSDAFEMATNAVQDLREMPRLYGPGINAASEIEGAVMSQVKRRKRRP